LGKAHLTLHFPQLSRVLSGVSQPGRAVQSPQPLLQDKNVHVPEAQLASALRMLHPTKHSPQLMRVFKGVSHPSASFWLQLPKPGGQINGHLRNSSQPFATSPSQFKKPGEHATNWHVPLVHTPFALGNRQGLLQEPQSVSAVVRLVSQPVFEFLSQSPNPGGQTRGQVVVDSHPFWLFESQLKNAPAQPRNVQFPDEQSANAFVITHGTLHPPQLVRVVILVSQGTFQFPSHSAVPAGHGCGQLEYGCSHPFPPSPSQLVKPGSHLSTSHSPVELHIAVAWDKVQRLLQAPQLEVVLSGVSQRSVASKLQSP
jgi:hypothetical protein